MIKKETYEITIDYSIPLKEIISKANFDNQIFDDLQPDDNYLIFGKKEVKKEVSLFYFEENKTTEQIIDEMNKNNKRPVNVEEFFSFAGQHPGVQKESIIVCLGYKYGEKENVLGTNGRAYPIILNLNEEKAKSTSKQKSGRSCDLIPAKTWLPGVYFAAVKNEDY